MVDYTEGQIQMYQDSREQLVSLVERVRTNQEFDKGSLIEAMHGFCQVYLNRELKKGMIEQWDFNDVGFRNIIIESTRTYLDNVKPYLTPN